MNKLVAMDTLSAGPMNEARFSQMKWIEPTVRMSLKVLGKSKPGVELTLVSRLVGSMRVIALHVLSKTGLRAQLATPRTMSAIEGFDAKMLRAFLDWAVDLGIVLRRSEVFTLASAYVEPLAFDADEIIGAIQSSDAAKWKAASAKVAKERRRDAAADFVFSALLINVRRKRQLDPDAFKVFNVPVEWGRLVVNEEYGSKMVDMCQYVFELLRSNLKAKVEFSQAESFFSEMARSAFQDMMKEFFIGAGTEIVASYGVRSVLDVGCGYGDYLEECLKLPGVERLVGVERQGPVAKACAERFAGEARVVIVNADVASAELNGPFDMAILSFVLFYFSDENKLALLRRIRELLSSKGVLLMCQYFPNVAGLQERLAEQKGEYTMKTRTGMYFMTKLLFAETLLNETLTAFEGAERWESFNQTLRTAGFKVQAVTNADELYYSLFLVAAKSDGSIMKRSAEEVVHG